MFGQGPLIKGSELRREWEARVIDFVSKYWGHLVATVASTRGRGAHLSHWQTVGSCFRMNDGFGQLA